MRKFVVALIISMGLALYGCGDTSQTDEPIVEEENASEIDAPNIQAEKAAESETDEKLPEDTVEIADTAISQGGPYGEISISLPSGWSYELCPMDSDELVYGMYGIKIYPNDADDGYIAVNYVGSFGVCGMGLVEESATVAGKPVSIGTFDNHEYWDFVAFQGTYDGVVALTYDVDDWWGEYGDRAIDILNTLSYDQSVKEGGACIDSEESEIKEIALYFTLENITPTGATLVFNQYDAKTPKGELIYGEDFVIEVLKDGKWEEAPITVEGDYAFYDIGYNLPCEEISEKEMDWEWLYGELAPGEYRIGKSVIDLIESGNFDKYMAYAHFILN